MPTTNLPFTPAIKIAFKGFVITRIRDGAASAEVGALRDSPCHRPKVEVRQITPDDVMQPFPTNLPDVLTEDFSLAVENALTTGIQVFQKDTGPFNRLDEENDSRDFRWFIDFPDFFQKPITIDAGKLGPFFRLDNGIFFTSTLSGGEVRITRDGSDTGPRFGKYGLEITANIYFDRNGNRADRKAVLKYGNTEIFTVTEAERTRYEVDFKCDCNVDLSESDFPLVFDVIGQGLSAEDKSISLEGDVLRPGPNHTPETYCGGGNCSSC